MIGSWLCSASPIVAELMSICGYDYLAIDAEHSPVDIEKTFHMLQAIKSGNPDCKALVRLSGNSYTENKRYMDAGADGLICPMINSKEDVQELIDSIKYHPKGKRGVGYSRSNNYGLELQNSVSNDNDRTFVCIQIEHIDAINNLDEILSVEGVDAAMIGPYDLSNSMNLTGQFNHPDVEVAVSKMLEKCIEYGVMPGIHIVKPDTEQVKDRITQGYRFIAYSVDITMISELSTEALSNLKTNI